ncbi:MAG: hypothetical protein AVDCRST_MAG36-2375 [uncultured Nocardioidaceae bacterium]|uniref:N-acetylmuramoyl-L-alanine amidase n=1 Tax=uncultured Nocardioidaceae bacterium TaxID=253824 RepID=A0A6J4MGN8_9ACTN|nr:MAG: hypothetical protein AVDCRST_MAG36-2375 [uncultured Nocardioidaceae bacterium]
MSPNQARLVTLCQQTLALGVVLAVLTPASGVVSLDIVDQRPGDTPVTGTTSPAGACALGLASATVPTRAVTPEVTEVPLTTGTGGTAGLGGRTVQGRPTTSTRVVSTPQPVTGYGAVGVTWEHGQELEEEQITVRVRTRTGDTWSAWEDLEYHDEHGPDPDSPEGASTRPGTEPLLVGDVDDVQVETRTTGTPLPDDLSLALVDPGATRATSRQAPAAGSADPGGTASYEADHAAEGSLVGADQADGISLSAASATTQPTVFTRAQWGADESMRDRSSLRYGSISAGFVHHTVNANDYTEAQVPAIMRSIYAYHTRSRGWSDIGYNFLVDRFGRIWEGRYGGIDKPVVGAHTLGYNEYSFAMSAIGNFDTVQPPDVMLRAYGQLFAWKLSLHGVNPASTSQRVGSRTFAAINGHRDAGSTACPGRYLYAQIPRIRTYATQAAPTTPVPPAPPAPTQVTVGAPAPQNNLLGTPYPDIVVRRQADGAALVVPTGGLTSIASRVVVGKKGWDERSDVLVSPDLTGDAFSDLVTADRDGVVRVRAGKGNGKFGATVKKLRLRKHSLLAAVGDLDGDGRNDLVSRHKGYLTTLLGTARGFARKRVVKGFGNYLQLVGPGDLTGDGRSDVVARRKGGLHLYPGDGAGGFGAAQRLGGSWSGYDRIVAGDYTADGRPDIVARARSGKVYVFPGLGGTSFGAPLGPVANLRSVRFLSGGGQLVGGAGSDLMGVSGEKLVVLANRDTFDLGAPVETGVSFTGMNLILNAGDVNRDGFGDVLTRDAAGQLWLFTGNGQGRLAAGRVLSTGWGPVSGLTAVGDVTGDGLPDLMGTLGGRLTVWRGDGTTFTAGAPVAGRPLARAGLPADLAPFDWVIGVQDLRLRAGNDFIVRERTTGRLYLYEGRASGISSPRLLGEGWGAFDLAG